MSDDRRLPYRIEIERSAERVMRRLPRDLLNRLRTAIDALAADPRPPGCRRLAGYTNLYRVRVGDWRISYAVEDDRLLIIVIEVAPRGGAYRSL